MPVHWHGSYCVPYFVESLRCVVSAWLLRQCGVLRLRAQGPLDACRVNTCRSEGLPLPGDCTHNITLPSPLAFSSRCRPKGKNCSLWSSFSHFKFPSARLQTSPGTHQSRELLGKLNWNALSDSRFHTLNGNLNKKHPHCHSRFLSPLVWESCMEFMCAVQWKFYLFIAEAYLSMGHKR